MVTKQDQIRDKLEKRLFSLYGKSVTLINKTSPIYNSRGEIDSDTSNGVSILIVPYNIVNRRQSHEAFGKLEEGETDAAVPYDTVIDVDDTLDMEGDTWIVKQIEENYLPGNVVTIIRMVKQEA